MSAASHKSARSSLKRTLKKDKEAHNDVPKKKISATRPEVLHTFLSYDQVIQYLKFVESRYSSFVKLHTIGSSYEHRDIKAIEIDWNSPKNTLSSQIEKSSQTNKPKHSEKESILKRNTIFIEAGTHAREWITISVALSCVYQLTENYKRNMDILRKVKFYIVPLTNPDGYEYSRLKNKKWRKNRRPHKNSKFVGTDCNRNYDFHWGTGGSKMSGCTYRGEKPFSEPETRAMRDILSKLGPQILFFLSLHSCGQSIMYPWGYTKEDSVDRQNLETLATTGKNAIASCNGREYRIGSISNVVKSCVSGSVVDYAYGQVKIPLALVMELPSRSLGFQPPREMISPLGYESWFGIREMCRCAHLMRVAWDNKNNQTANNLLTIDPIGLKPYPAFLTRKLSGSLGSSKQKLSQQRVVQSAVVPRKQYANLLTRREMALRNQTKQNKDSVNSSFLQQDAQTNHSTEINKSSQKEQTNKDALGAYIAQIRYQNDLSSILNIQNLANNLNKKPIEKETTKLGKNPPPFIFNQHLTQKQQPDIKDSIRSGARSAPIKNSKLPENIQSQGYGIFRLG